MGLVGLEGETARVYLALVRLGEATASEVAERAGIPTNHAYGALNRLLKKGLVVIVGGRPRRYIALEPKRKLTELRRKISRKLNEEFDRLLENIPESQIKRELTVFLQRRAMKEVALEDLKNARCVKAMLGIKCFLGTLLSDLFKLSERGVKVRLIMGSSSQIPFDKGASLEVRGVHILPPLDMLVLDGNVVYLALDLGQGKGFLGVRVEGPSAKPYDDYFDHLWVEHYAAFMRRARAWRIEELY